MRILQIIHNLPFYSQAGTEVYTHGLSLELSKKHEVYIFSRTCNLKQGEYAISKKVFDKIAVYSINNTFKHCNSFEMYYENDTVDARFAELLDELKPDVAHIQHLLFLSIGLIKKLKEKNIPIVFTLHDYWLMCPRWHILKKDNKPCDRAVIDEYERECIDCLEETLNIRKGAVGFYILTKGLLPEFVLKGLKYIYISYNKKIVDNDNCIGKLKERKRKIKDILNNVDIFLAPSEYLRHMFIKFGVPPEKIKLCRYGLDNGLFKNPQKKENNKMRFAFIGTILPAKGLHVLINAFNKIRKENAELKIYGKMHYYAGFENYLPHLKKLIKNKNIKFMDGFEHQEAPDIFREIDVLVVPSIWYENYPLIIQEAFLSRTPVIASRIGGIPELVSDGVSGLLFNPGDADELRGKIQYIIDNPDIRQKLKKNIPEVKSIEDNAKEIEEIYGVLLAGRCYENKNLKRKNCLQII